MKSFLNLAGLRLLALLLGLCAALPLIGGDECGGGGENGVWILPRVGSVTRDPLVPFRPLAEARAVKQISDLTRDFAVQTSGNTGSLVAVMVYGLAGTTGVQVMGNDIIVPASVLQAIVSSGVRRVDILVLDEERQGYLISLVVDDHRQLAAYVF